MENSNPKFNPIKTGKKSQFNPYIKYSGLAFQMIAVIGLAVWGGMRLDAHFAFAFPWFTVVLSVLGFVGAILGVIRSLPKGEE